LIAPFVFGFAALWYLAIEVLAAEQLAATADRGQRDRTSHI
jgi:hypothetical protein